MAERSPEESLLTIGEAVFRELADTGQAGSCIAGSSLLLKVLHLMGHATAFPLCVRVRILNKRFLEWIAEHGVVDTTEKLNECYAAGGTSASIGYPPGGIAPDNGWPGHLVVIVPNVYEGRHLMMDLTIVQAHMPELDLPVPAVCVRVRESFMTDGEDAQGTAGDSLLIYNAFPEDESYKETPAWQVTEDIDQSAMEIVARLQEQRLVVIGTMVLKFLEANGEENSCVFAGALLVRVLHRLGYPNAYPLTVRVDIENPALVEWEAKHGEPVTDADFEARDKAGACIIQLGREKEGFDPKRDWAGHLGVVVPKVYGENHMLLDLTLPQVNRSEEGVDLIPARLEVSQEFVAGGVDSQAMMNGCRLSYDAFPDDLSYEEFDEWTNEEMDKVADWFASELASRL